MSEIENIPKEVIAKIQKLIKLEESANKIGNQAEAENAAAKIRDIMMKHNLDLYKVQSAGDQTQKKEAVGEQDHDPESLTRPHEGQWVTMMVKALAPTYLCKVLTYGSSKKVCIVGTPSNVEILWYTTEQLCNRIRPIAREEFRKYRGREKRNTYFRGFYVGAVNGIKDRLSMDAQRETYKAKEAEEVKMEGKPINEEQTNALAIISMTVERHRDIERYIQSNMNVGTSHKRGPSYSGVSGKVAGYQTGNKMGINAGMGSGTRPGQKRIG